MKDLVIEGDAYNQRASPQAQHAPIYFVTGQSRPLRNLIKLTEHGHSGKCRAQSVLENGQSLKNLTYQEVCWFGQLVEQTETDEEVLARLEHQNSYEPQIMTEFASRLTIPRGDFAVSHLTAHTISSEEVKVARKFSNHEVNKQRLERAQTLRPPETAGHKAA